MKMTDFFDEMDFFLGLPEFGVIDMELTAKRYLADKSCEMIFRCLGAARMACHAFSHHCHHSKFRKRLFLALTHIINIKSTTQL